VCVLGLLKEPYKSHLSRIMDMSLLLWAELLTMRSMKICVLQELCRGRVLTILLRRSYKHQFKCLPFQFL